MRLTPQVFFRLSTVAQNYSFEGKNVLITGGTRGIGLAIAKSLLNAGVCRVCTSDVLPEGPRVAEELGRKYGKDRVMFMKVDVTNHKQFEEAFKYLRCQWKRIDILVNNAGILNDKKWNLMIDINLKGVVLGSHLGMQYMGTGNGGCGGDIINVASILGVAPLPSTPVYVTTKHGVIGFTRSMGSDYHFKDSKVRFMALCPGVTSTMMIETSQAGGFTPKMGEDLAKDLGSLPPQPAEKCGEHVVHMLKCGGNGSVWISESGETYEVAIPERQAMRVK